MKLELDQKHKEFLKETYPPVECPVCNILFDRKSVNKKYCGKRCAKQAEQQRDKERRTGSASLLRSCKICGKEFSTTGNRKHCSRECSLQSIGHSQQSFKEAHPESMKRYNKHRVIDNPQAWLEKQHKGRVEALAALGGKCSVPSCPTTNPYHLHIDYIPTMRGTGKRHPKHAGYVLRNLEKFRILCANHHYELTITGKIEGTDIVQKSR